MNVCIELEKLGIEPYDLTEKEWDTYYTSLYNVLALDGKVNKVDLWFAADAIINMFLLRQAGYIDTDMRTTIRMPKTETPQVFNAGDHVQWTSSGTLKVGVYLGLIPAGRTPIECFAELTAITKTQDKFGYTKEGDSEVERACIRVDRADARGRALLPFYYGARVSQLQKVNKVVL